MTFEEFVGNKKIEWEHDSKTHCPFCKSTEVSSYGSVCTLIGGRSPEKTNHYWDNFGCEKCNKDFVREHKSGYQWYTIKDNSIVVEGIHNCFEHYEYKCQCGGMIKKEYRELDKKTSFWVCDKCKKEIEYDY